MEEESTEPITFVVADGEAKERLDKVLVGRIEGESRGTLQRWIREGRVHVDGSTASPKQKLKPGERVDVRPAKPPTTHAQPQDLPLSILFEDEHLVFVDKAAGMVVHPGAGNADGTLVNALLHHFGALPGDDPQRPGIVHRIDAGTSGVMVVAKTEVARLGLIELFSQHAIERAYTAIALGEVRERVSFDTMYGRDPRSRIRFSSKVRGRKRAITHVERLEIVHGASIVRCRLETGRTHQIRVHLADAGHPLLGDPVYGRRVRDEVLKKAGELGRQALHASHLGFRHPVSGEQLSVDSPLAPDIFEAAELLRAARGSAQ